MNSWEIIKKEMTRPTTKPGTTGELVDASNASRVYMALREKLRDKEKADAAFNADELVTKALLSRKFLESIGVA